MVHLNFASMQWRMALSHTHHAWLPVTVAAELLDLSTLGAEQRTDGRRSSIGTDECPASRPAAQQQVVEVGRSALALLPVGPAHARGRGGGRVPARVLTLGEPRR